MGNGVGCQFWYLQTDDLNTFEGELSQEIERISDLSKTRAKFSSCFSRPLFIFYHIPEGYSTELTIWWEFERDVYGERYWLIIFVFVNGR